MACAEVLMMALLAALKKNNITSQPIVMWLGNSFSPGQLLPWPYISKQLDELSKHPPGIEMTEPEIMHFHPDHRKTAEPKSPSRKSPFKKGYQSQNRKKGGRGKGKGKKKGKGKQGKKGKGRGKPHRKKRPPKMTPLNKGDEGKPGHEPEPSMARGAKSTANETENEGGNSPGAGAHHQKATTREHQNHGHHEGGHHGDSEKPGTKHHRKEGIEHTTTSFMWTAFKKLSSMFTPSGREQGAGRTGGSESPSKLTSKHHKPKHHTPGRHKHHKGHPTSATHETTGSAGRRHSADGSSKTTDDTMPEKKHQTKHGQPSDSSHQHKATATQPLLPSSEGATKDANSGRESTKKRTEGSIQAGSTAEKLHGPGLEEDSVYVHTTKTHASSRSHDRHSEKHSKATPEYEATADLTTGETRQQRKASLSSSLPEESGSSSSQSSGGKGPTSALSMTTKSGSESGPVKQSSGDARTPSFQSTSGEKPEASSTTHKASKRRRRRHHKRRHWRNRDAHQNSPPAEESNGVPHSRPKAGPQRTIFRAAGDDKQASQKLPLMLRTVPIMAHKV